MDPGELNFIPLPVAMRLQAAEWTLEKLATAAPKDLAELDIGQALANEIISEARKRINEHMLYTSRNLDQEAIRAANPRFRPPPSSEVIMNLLQIQPALITMLVEKGWDVQKLARAEVKDLTKYKGIGKKTAENIIEQAKSLTKTYYPTTAYVEPGEVVKGGSAAFPVEWLSGIVAPPPMSVRVQRNFEQAKAAYEAQAAK